MDQMAMVFPNRSMKILKHPFWFFPKTGFCTAQPRISVSTYSTLRITEGVTENKNKNLGKILKCGISADGLLFNFGTYLRPPISQDYCYEYIGAHVCMHSTL